MRCGVNSVRRSLWTCTRVPCPHEWHRFIGHCLCRVQGRVLTLSLVQQGIAVNQRRIGLCFRGFELERKRIDVMLSIMPSGGQFAFLRVNNGVESSADGH